jgi:SAM-dependent methyltransferase
MRTIHNAVSAFKTYTNRRFFPGHTQRSTFFKPDLEYITCPGCKSERSTPWAEENGYSAVKCADCGMIYVNPRPQLVSRPESVKAGKHPTEDGSIDVTSKYSGRRAAHYGRMVSRILSDVTNEKEPVSWLDIGAGHGEMVLALHRLLPPGSSVEGIEPNERKVKSANSRGINVSQKDLDSVTGKFDVISLINVYSHLTDPAEFIADLRRLLKDGGNILIRTGNAADLDSRKELPNELYLPDHLVFTGETQLRGLLDELGFDVVAIRYERYDTIVRCAKSVVKKVIGRPACLVFPGSSKFRFLWVLGRLRARGAIA